jgi:hypothetical protein
MAQQMEQMQAENQSLRKTTSDLTNSLATVGSRRSGTQSSMTPQPDSPGAIVDAARNTLGVPTGMALPT